MSDNSATFTAFMDAERARLLAAARRTQALDHDTNRGSDYERTIRAWLRDLVAPQYEVAVGEIIDSFNTHRDRDRRQQDAIVHKNTWQARRFSFGDDLRLVPIESVAVTTEVKLSIDLPRFKVADASAAMTNELRLAVDRITRPMKEDAELGFDVLTEGRVRGPTEGTRVAAAYKRVWFGIVAAEGPKVETLASWLQHSKAIDFICCLSTGCAFRPPFARTASHPAMKSTDVAPADRSLTRFADVIRLSLHNFEHHDKDQDPDWSRYHPYMPVRFYDATGYGEPAGVRRLPEEAAELRRMRGGGDRQSRRKEGRTKRSG